MNRYEAKIYADVIAAYAKGEAIEYKHPGNKDWEPLGGNLRFYEGVDYRVRPVIKHPKSQWILYFYNDRIEVVPFKEELIGIMPKGCINYARVIERPMCE